MKKKYQEQYEKLSKEEIKQNVLREDYSLKHQKHMIEISERNMLYIKGGVMGDIKNKKEGYTLLSEDFLR